MKDGAFTRNSRVYKIVYQKVYIGRPNENVMYANMKLRVWPRSLDLRRKVHKPSGDIYFRCRSRKDHDQMRCCHTRARRLFYKIFRNVG